MDTAKAQSDAYFSSRKMNGIDPFYLTLAKHGLSLVRAHTSTLQINMGLLCNQSCSHCHLSAGPGRTEMMDSKTLGQVVDFAGSNAFETIDITGGAPELHPYLSDFIKSLSLLCSRIILRSNLTALSEQTDGLLNLLKERGAVIVASFPSLNPAQTDALRGKGSFQTGIHMLTRLNALGYGKKDSGLELDLIVNPTGAFLPPSQAETEKRFRTLLRQKRDIEFNNLFSFANVPLGRYRHWLIQSGNFEKYLKKLASSFNPCAIEGLMCRTLLSVSWEGFLYDCDFNQASGLFLGNEKIHISELKNPPEPGRPIAVDDHCYTCTAGSGFT